MTPLGARVVPEVKAISAGPAGSARHRARPAARRRAGRRTSCSRAALVDAHQTDDRDVGAQVRLERHPPELLGGDEDLAAARWPGCGRAPCGRRSARSARRPRRGTPTPRTSTAASIQFGSCSATTSPGPTPRRRRPAASRRAASSTSAKVPAKGRTSECTTNPASGLAAKPSARRSPSVSGVHHPSSS